MQNIANGILSIREKNTNKEIIQRNMVVKNAMHIAILGLNGSLSRKSIKVASWGDNYEETPPPTTFNMYNIQSLEKDDQSKQNNTVSTLDITSYNYPASKAISFNFEMNENTHPELIDKNIQEYGLFFDNMMFSRIVLENEFIFEDWMELYCSWTIIFSDYYGDFSNILLDKYKLGSVWTIKDKKEHILEGSLEVINVIDDKIGKNDLSGTLLDPVLTNEILYNGTIDESDLINGNSILIPYMEEDTKNLLKIHHEDQSGLDLKNTFTISQWFKLKDILNPDSYANPENSLPDEFNENVLLSKWVKGEENENSSYRIYISKEEINSSSSSSFSSESSESSISSESSESSDSSDSSDSSMSSSSSSESSSSDGDRSSVSSDSTESSSSESNSSDSSESSDSSV